MEMTIDFPGGARVDAHFGSFVVPTDQPPSGGGQSSAPTPFLTFLSTIGTCAGIYVLGFCRQRGIAPEGIRLLQRMESDPLSGLVSRVTLDIQLPPDFPVLQQTGVRYRWDGEETFGMMERSSRKDRISR